MPAAIINSAVIGYHAQYTAPGGELKAAQIAALGSTGLGGWASTAMLSVEGQNGLVEAVFSDDTAQTGTYRWPGGMEPAFGFARETSPWPSVSTRKK